MDAPTVNDSSPATGAPFTLSATVRNAGDGESAATTLRFYQSTDETITTADTEAGTAAVGGLAASATSSESINLTAPSTAGTYYYGACVDAVTDESDSTNNCSTSVQVTVPAPPPPAQADDRVALEALYDATNGANWANNTSWNSSAPLDQWYGVFTNANGRVTQLVLTGNGLTGSIPSSLGSLTNLLFLSLSNNDLTGSIPSSLGSLTNLQELSIAATQLTGSIPSSLGSLTNLTQLDLHFNQLTGSIPSSLGSLTNLTTLWLFDNKLSGTIPAELGNLTRLRSLRLDTATGLCLAPDFDLTSPFATLSRLPVC